MTTKEKILNTREKVVFSDIADGAYFYNARGHLIVKTDSFYSTDEVDYNALNLTLKIPAFYRALTEITPLDKVDFLVEGTYIEE